MLTESSQRRLTRLAAQYGRGIYIVRSNGIVVADLELPSRGVLLWVVGDIVVQWNSGQEGKETQYDHET